MRYAFVRANQEEFAIRNLCKMMRVHRSGYYAWLNQPKSPRQVEDERLLGLIKQFWLESGCIYGYRKIYKDLRELGEVCGINRVARLMKKEGLKAQVGYRNRATRVAMSLSRRKIVFSRISVYSIPTKHGSPTSRTCAPMRGGCFWRL